LESWSSTTYSPYRVDLGVKSTLIQSNKITVQNISGQGAQLNQADMAGKLNKQGEPQPKKIIITGLGLDLKCNVIVFTSEG
jgi:hypothetical protein